MKPLGCGNFSLEDVRGLLIGLEFSLGKETDSPTLGSDIGGVDKGSVKTCMIKNFLKIWYNELNPTLSNSMVSWQGKLS